MINYFFLETAGIFATYFRTLADVICADAEAAKYAAGTGGKGHATFQRFLFGGAQAGNFDLAQAELLA